MPSPQSRQSPRGQQQTTEFLTRIGREGQAGDLPIIAFAQRILSAVGRKYAYRKTNSVTFPLDER
jgi:hypothetical protein